MGPWAVDLALSVGIFPYVLKLLQTTAPDLRQILVFIWTKILALDRSCQLDLVKDSGHVYFVRFLDSPSVPSEERAMAAFVLAAIADDHPKGQAACAKLLLTNASIHVNRQNDLGATAAFLAAVHGHAACLEALLAHPDVDAYAPDRDGTTPLEAAEHTAGSEACAVLLRAHAAAHAEEDRSPTGASPPAVAVA